MVAGFRQWQTKGRRVRKGESSIEIFGYREKQTATRDTDTAETVENDERTARYFPMLSDFDITQTDPIEGAEPLPEDPTEDTSIIRDTATRVLKPAHTIAEIVERHE